MVELLLIEAYLLSFYENVVKMVQVDCNYFYATCFSTLSSSSFTCDSFFTSYTFSWLTDFYVSSYFLQGRIYSFFSFLI